MASEMLDEKAIFNVARQIGPPDARADYLRQACGPDSGLRERVEVLLHAYEEQASFLESPPPVGAVPTMDQPASESLGTVIGPYKLVEQIGEGGMGTVWMAQQTEPVKRLVALKLIKPGMDSKQVIARFEAERQALALMEHPNIARVLDGGTTPAGRPYFVMDLVKGVPITRYCDELHLTPRERLELFIPVCQAVQHAHQKGVIHRDLKPSNVLVAPYDGRPVVKVIDFGVVKAAGQPLTEKTLVTGLGAVVGTPEYMSPEQAGLNNADIDTRSDIYSLGVLLYELLTGTTPLQRKQVTAAVLEVLRLVREEEPPRPSTRLSATAELPQIAAARGLEPRKLSGLVRGELDWIVMRALEKDRTRRYETADGLARDVERYLRDEPVEASPPGAAYRVRKFVKRNKGRVAAAGLLLAALLAGTAGTTWGMIRAEEARRDAVASEAAEVERADGERGAKEEAKQRLAQLERGTEILASVFRDLDPIAAEKAGVTSRDLVCRRLGEVARQLEGEAVGHPLVVARLQHLVGVSLRELRHPEQAEGVLLKAFRTRERLLGPDDLETIATKHHLAITYRKLGKHAPAEALFQEVLAVRTTKLGPDDLETVATKHQFGTTYRILGKNGPAEELLREALAVRAARLGADDLETIATKHELAALYVAQGKHDPAEALFQEVLTTRTTKLGADHPDVASTQHHLAKLYRAQEKYAEAEELLGKSVAIRAARLGDNDLETLSSRKELADVYCDHRQYDLAEPLRKQILATWIAHRHDRGIVCGQHDLAALYQYMNKPEQAIPLLADALERCKATGHPSTLGVQADFGASYRDARRFAEAIPLLEEVCRRANDRPDLAWVGNALLTSYVGAGRKAEAAALAKEQVREARERLPADSPELAAELAPPGQALLEVGAYADAEPLLLIRYRGLRQSEARVPPRVDPRLRDAVEHLVWLYDAWGKPIEAAKWKKVLEARAAARAKEPKGR
jgi:serine/threonine protein kinase/tetratricopeptide (TPR) repeat protein